MSVLAEGVSSTYDTVDVILAVVWVVGLIVGGIILWKAP